MSTVSTVSPAWQWPADILTFATQHKVAAFLDPLLVATRKVYPTARSVRVFLEDDPEIRDDWHIIFEVRVPKVDIPDYVAATDSWTWELFRICPAPLACIFRLTLLRVAS